MNDETRERNIGNGHVIYTADERVWINFVGESVPRVGERVSGEAGDLTVYGVKSVSWLFLPTLIYPFGSPEYASGVRDTECKAAARVLVEPLERAGGEGVRT